MIDFSFVPNPLNFTPSEIDKHFGKMYPYLQGYDISKLALVLHAKELAKQLAGKSRPGVYSCCCSDRFCVEIAGHVLFEQHSNITHVLEYLFQFNYQYCSFVIWVSLIFGDV